MPASVAYAPAAFAEAAEGASRLRLAAGTHPPRLTVCLPHAHKDHVFGGVSSVLELARFLAPRYPRLRFVSLSPLPEAGSRLDLSPFAKGREAAPPELADLHGDTPLAVDAGDIFLCSFWRSVLVWEAFAGLLGRQGRPANPFYYFIQDWEPGFYPLGLDHLLAEASYGHGQSCLAVVNSLELARFLAQKRYGFGRTVAVRPSLNPHLAQALSALGRKLPPRPTDRLTILAYGRPGHPRNCFPAVLDGLWRWLAAFRPALPGPVTLLSAGTPHENIVFPDGSELTSLGMLSLPDYAATLLQSHVGIAFMASPHPSYPPLEMAAFGLEVVTNAFAGKDLSKAHPAIRNAPPHRPAETAAALREAVTAALAGAGQLRPAVLPASLCPDGWQTNFRRAAIPILRPSA